MRWSAGLVLLGVVCSGCGAAGADRDGDEVTFVEPKTVRAAGDWAQAHDLTLTAITFVHRSRGEVETIRFLPQTRMRAEELERTFRAETLPSLRGVAKKLRGTAAQRLVIREAIAAVRSNGAGVVQVTVCADETCPLPRLDSGT
jgi:hypothetical protein